MEKRFPWSFFCFLLQIRSFDQFRLPSVILFRRSKGHEGQKDEEAPHDRNSNSNWFVSIHRRSLPWFYFHLAGCPDSHILLFRFFIHCQIESHHYFLWNTFRMHDEKKIPGAPAELNSIMLLLKTDGFQVEIFFFCFRSFWLILHGW